MIRARSLLLMAGILATLGPPSARADISTLPVNSEGHYQESLDRTIRMYPTFLDIPNARIEMLSRESHHLVLEVMADLVLREDLPSRPISWRLDADSSPSDYQSSPGVQIPWASWNREAVLIPDYEFLLEEVINKYRGVAFVPEASVGWIARLWDESSTQVKYDLQRVQRHDPDKLDLQGYAH